MLICVLTTMSNQMKAQSGCCVTCDMTCACYLSSTYIWLVIDAILPLL